VTPLCDIGVESEGFEVLRAVVIKSSVIWDVTPCSLLQVNRRFRELCLLHLQGRRTSQARSQHEEGSNQSIILQKTELFRGRQIYVTDSILFSYFNHFIFSAILKVSLAHMYPVILSILKSIYIVVSSLQFYKQLVKPSHNLKIFNLFTHKPGLAMGI
jgi:hypothetical protein